MSSPASPKCFNGKLSLRLQTNSLGRQIKRMCQSQKNVVKVNERPQPSIDVRQVEVIYAFLVQELSFVDGPEACSEKLQMPYAGCYLPL